MSELAENFSVNYYTLSYRYNKVTFKIKVKGIKSDFEDQDQRYKKVTLNIKVKRHTIINIVLIQKCKTVCVFKIQHVILTYKYIIFLHTAMLDFH